MHTCYSSSTIFSHTVQMPFSFGWHEMIFLAMVLAGYGFSRGFSFDGSRLATTTFPLPPQHGFAVGGAGAVGRREYDPIVLARWLANPTTGVRFTPGLHRRRIPSGSSSPHCVQRPSTIWQRVLRATTHGRLYGEIVRNVTAVNVIVDQTAE
jgi:hypothetical protein